MELEFDQQSLSIIVAKYLTFGSLSIRFLHNTLNNDIFCNTNYENQNLIRANNQYHLFVSLNKLNQ